jgi:hypothetical protein
MKFTNYLTWKNNTKRKSGVHCQSYNLSRNVNRTYIIYFKQQQPVKKEVQYFQLRKRSKRRNYLRLFVYAFVF